jgi:cytochrome P450
MTGNIETAEQAGAGANPAFPFLKRGTLIPDPWALCDEIAATAPPIFWVEDLAGHAGGWVVADGQLMRSLLMDMENLSTKAILSERGASKHQVCPVPSISDDPDHAFYRGLANPLFVPKRFTRMEEEMRAEARACARNLVEQGGCELLDDFAFRFPIHIFLKLLGLPREMTSDFLGWANQILRGSDPEQIAAAFDTVCDYLLSEIEERRARPRDDMITYGIQAEFRGRKLNPQELLGFCFNLFGGGLDTVSASIGHHFIHLARHREQQQLLREQPERIGDAVEEMTRAYAVVVLLRECVRPMDICGQKIEPGQKLALPTPVANRDPNLYPDPARVDFDRKPQHLTFSTGPHFCLGGHLARRELRIAVEEFLKVVPDFRLDPSSKLEYDVGGHVIQPTQVVLQW